jgi:hypothetical protein
MRAICDHGHWQTPGIVDRGKNWISRKTEWRQTIRSWQCHFPFLDHLQFTWFSFDNFFEFASEMSTVLSVFLTWSKRLLKYDNKSQLDLVAHSNPIPFSLFHDLYCITVSC